MEEEEGERESGAGEERLEEQDLQAGRTTENEWFHRIPEEQSNSGTTHDSPIKLPVGAPTAGEKEHKNREKGGIPPEKSLKKPEKILPCPRCGSMDTKFCYYNNYNINQPRHFCKSCQRYWTDGGSMRNVPVGAGRRKNKCSAVPDPQTGIPSPLLKTRGTVMRFGAGSGEKTIWAGGGGGNGFLNPRPEFAGPGGKGGGQVDDRRSTGSSAAGGDTNSMEEASPEPPQIFHGFHFQTPRLPGTPWPSPWNAAVPIIYCAAPCAWPVPLVSPNPVTLGKHARDGTLSEAAEGGDPREQKGTGRNIWVPKTLRIDHPDEAAKSSIWATLGIEREPMGSRGLFEGFRRKSDGGDEASPVLRANPAAMFRSLDFHEGS